MLSSSSMDHDRSFKPCNNTNEIHYQTITNNQQPLMLKRPNAELSSPESETSTIFNKKLHLTLSGTSQALPLSTCNQLLPTYQQQQHHQQQQRIFLHDGYKQPSSFPQQQQQHHHHNQYHNHNNHNHNQQLGGANFSKTQGGKISIKSIHNQRNLFGKQKLSNANLSTISSSNTSTRHLVKTVSDLPIFVTIEGYLVASYSICGEPHLCLPQLLQHLREKFSLKRMIETFEKPLITFATATLKQVNGFIKAGVLPTTANTCPLIKRSDADKICLRLFEQCIRSKTNDIVAVCSNNRNEILADENQDKYLSVKKQEQQQSSHKEDNLVKASQIDTYKCNTDLNDDDDHEQTIGSVIKPQQQQLTSSSKPLISQKERVLSKVRDDLFDASKEDATSNHTVYGQELEKAQHNYSSEKDINGETENSDNLNETHKSILNLAKSVTSTLRIRIYHRCFGKGCGIFFQHLLVDSESACIECATCHIMLTPRRFIGHTHGPKEKNVCHWGFNSYNWRYYLRLSQKQTMNKLGEEELVSRFEKLISVANGSENNEESNYDFDKPTSDEEVELGKRNERRGASSCDSWLQAPKIINRHEFKSLNPTNYDKNPKLEAQNYTQPDSQQKSHPVETNNSWSSFNSYTTASPLSLTRENKLTTPIPYGQLVADNRSSQYNLTQMAMLTSQTNYHLGDDNYLLNRGLSFPPQPIEAPLSMTSPAPSLGQLNPVNTYIRQDFYMATNLTSHLNALGLSSNLTKDIVEVVLNLNRRSRALM